MLKHLPEGLTPFEDCGFARRPLYPLAGEAVTVFCRADTADGQPELLMSVDGGREETHAPAGRDGRFYRFELGAFALGAHVSYSLRSSSEQSQLFTFEAQRERMCEIPVRLLREDGAAHAVFEGFAVTFRAGESLEIHAHQEAVAGTECAEISLDLPCGFSLELKQQAHFCQLKRFSKSIADISGYTVHETARGEITRITQRGALAARYVWGTGERFDAVNQRGLASNGRVVEKFTQQGNQTYLPMPFFLTECGLGWYARSAAPVEMDFDGGLTLSREARSVELSRDTLFFGEPKELIARFVTETGRPVLPPDWAFGVWISANGWSNDAEVDAQLAALKAHGYPADVMVLEARSDEQTFYRWNGDGSWKNPAETVRRIRESGLHLVLWQIPIIKHEWNQTPGEALKADIGEAVEKGYCVARGDGQPYRITENWFHHSLLLDFTNPEAVRWWFDKRKYLLDMGVEGFKTDGGEFLFDHEARMFGGQTGLEAHNLYPGQYIGAYHDFMRQNGVNGVTFSRADYTGAQTRPLHWAGDQLSEWSELAAQLKAGISAGLSGVLFWGFDIGGFAGKLPTKELYLRATAMGCFSPVMQWHAEPRNGQFYATHEAGFNNDRSPLNLAAQLGDPEILTIATRFALLRQALRPYLTKEARHCAKTGRPMMAHLCVDFPDDEQALACEDAYMLGRKLLVAPVTQPGAVERDVYLPRGRWRGRFTGEILTGGRTVHVNCPLDSIPVFERLNEDD